MAAPAERPALGRKPQTRTFASSDVSPATETSTNSSGNDNLQLNQFPQPSLESPTESKQTGRPSNVGNRTTVSHVTSIPVGREPASAGGGGSSTWPVRATRNPNPYYVDSFHRPWSASPADITRLNELISSGLKP